MLQIIVIKERKSYFQLSIQHPENQEEQLNVLLTKYNTKAKSLFNMITHELDNMKFIVVQNGCLLSRLTITENELKILGYVKA